MSNCSGIFQNQLVSCDNPLSVGTTQRILVANREDVSVITYSAVAGEENVVTGITMKTTKRFFEFGGVNESISMQQELVRRTVSNGYKMTVNCIVFETDNTTRLNLQAMAYKPQIAIVYGVDDSSLGNGAFNVMGVDVGMDLLTNVNMPADVESGGGYQLGLGTPDTGGDEKALAPVFWDTDYTSTLVAVNALLNIAP